MSVSGASHPVSDRAISKTYYWQFKMTRRQPQWVFAKIEFSLLHSPGTSLCLTGPMFPVRFLRGSHHFYRTGDRQVSEVTVYLNMLLM